MVGTKRMTRNNHVGCANGPTTMMTTTSIQLQWQIVFRSTRSLARTHILCVTRWLDVVSMLCYAMLCAIISYVYC